MPSLFATVGIVAAGAEGEIFTSSPQVALARYTADGRPDSAFGSGDKRLEGPGVAADVLAQSDGEVLVAGGARPDRAFGRSGFVVGAFEAAAAGLAVAIGGDGKIVAAGAEYGSGDKIAVARYLATRCVVPRVIGKTLAGARSVLARADCSVGEILRVRSRVKAGRVVAQSARPGARLGDGARVGLSLSRG